MQNFEIVQKLRELNDKINELKEESDILQVKIKNKITEVDSLRDKRDRLNKRVQELSKKPKEILSERKDMWENIEETNEEKKRIYKEMQPYLQRIGELRKVRDRFNDGSRGTMDRLVDNYKGTRENLMTSDVNLKNELFLYEYLFEIRDRILIKARADTLHQEIVKIKEVDLAKFNKELGAMENQIGELKSQSHEGLEEAKELWNKRDEMRDLAQKEHKGYIEAVKQLKTLKKNSWEKRKEIRDLFRKKDEWKKEFKKSPEERRQADHGRKTKDAVAKYKRGEKLSLEELSLVMESGEMN